VTDTHTQVQTKWEKFATNWIALGVYVFVLAFFWASGTANIRTTFYVFILLPWLFYIPWKKAHWQDFGGVYTALGLLLTGYIALSSLWGKENDVGEFARHWLMLAIWLTTTAWVIARGHINLERLLSYLVVVACISAVPEIIYFYLSTGYTLAVRLHGHGLAENPTLLAQLFGAACIIAYVKSMRSSARPVILLWFAASVICALPILLSQSRGALVALAIVGLAALIICRPRKSIIIWQIVLGCIALSLLLSQLDIISLLEKRGVDTNGRDDIWFTVLARVYEVPLFGIGAEYNARLTIPDVGIFHHAHNSWLDILYFSGLVGVFIALYHLWLLLSVFKRDSATILPLYLWFVFGCICLFTNGPHLLMPINAHWWVYWIPVGLLVGAHLQLLKSKSMDLEVERART
jgi:hypothetical protein